MGSWLPIPTFVLHTRLQNSMRSERCVLPGDSGCFWKEEKDLGEEVV